MVIMFFLISISSYSQTSFGEILLEAKSNSCRVANLVRSGDSIARQPSLSHEDSVLLKEYYRWRRDAVAHSTYEGAASASISELKSYLSNIPLFCGSGPQGYSWSSVGPNPTTANYQEIGIVYSLAVDPNNSDIIYAGTFESGM